MRISLHHSHRQVALADETMARALGSEAVEKYLGKALLEAVAHEVGLGNLDRAAEAHVRLEIEIQRKIQ